MKHLLLLSISCFISQISSQDLPSCDSQIFCQGNLLHTVQMAKIFNDSKSFVDKKLINNQETTLKHFADFLISTNNNPSREEIAKFVNDNFESYDEFENWVPADFTPTPKFLAKIQDEDVKRFAQNLVNIWPNLARKVKQEVIDTPEFFTLIPVEHGFIVPGGRFQEFYYWDSYWIIKGLLLCEMYDTARGMLDNFLSLVERYGFVPNGSRIYYLNRSQPPLLNLMVATYIQATNDTVWLANNIGTLDKELRFWLNNRVIKVLKDGEEYELAHYDSESGSPRPESYYEDVNTAKYYEDENAKKQLYAELKSGAESGLDFSSRWIIDGNGGTNGNLSLLGTRRIIPVDLNSYLYKAFSALSDFYIIVHDFVNAKFWLEKANVWKNNINKVLYNKEDGIWYDWNIQRSEPRKSFFPTNFAPLWAEAYDLSNAEEIGKRAAEYLVAKGIMEFEGGIPTSLSQTGEQWDYPNAWPPFQHIVILGLHQTGNCNAKNISKEFGMRWIKANMIGYDSTGEMFEKYDAVTPGKYGGGGEYTIQTGFGWTNGVVLDLIDRYYTSKSKN